MINSINNLISNFAKRLPQGESLMAQHIIDIANNSITEYFSSLKLEVNAKCVWYKKGAIGIKYATGMDAEIFSKHQNEILKMIIKKGINTVYRFIMII